MRCLDCRQQLLVLLLPEKDIEGLIPTAGVDGAAPAALVVGMPALAKPFPTGCSLEGQRDGVVSQCPCARPRSLDCMAELICEPCRFHAQRNGLLDGIVQSNGGSGALES